MAQPELITAQLSDCNFLSAYHAHLSRPDDCSCSTRPAELPYGLPFPTSDIAFITVTAE